MKKEYLKYIRIFCIFTVVISLLLLVLDICNINKFLKLTKDYDWLSYIGTVIAGIGTMLGIYFSFSQSQEIEKNRVKPCVNISKVDTKHFDRMLNLYSRIKDNDYYGPEFVIKVENGSNYELKNLKIHSLGNGEFYQFCYGGTNDLYVPGINPKENVLIRTYYQYPSINIKYIKKSKMTKVWNRLLLIFDDCYGNTYCQEFTVCFSMKFNEFNKKVEFYEILAYSSSSPVSYDKKMQKKYEFTESYPEKDIAEKNNIK